MKRKFLTLLTASLALVLLAGLAACSLEPRSVTIHEPGVYKGMKDPLLARQDQEKVLVDRFKLVQADR